jgi:hypothetical protein
LSHGNALNSKRKFFLRTTKGRLAGPSEIRALDFKKGISTIRDLLGFSDYQYRLVDFRHPIDEMSFARLAEIPSTLIRFFPSRGSIFSMKIS